MFEASAGISKATCSCMLCRQCKGDIHIWRGERITACTQVKGTNVELSCFCKLLCGLIMVS